jgi:hypothetical protein
MNGNTATAGPTATAITELTESAAGGRRVARAAVVWLPGVAVAVGAAVATAHGLYEVALAARVPAGIAWLYPLITDGLALVAYAATTRLHGQAARYAWSVVVLAAGLSGLAQAALLGSETTMNAPTVLRYGVGAWPAVAAAIVAHLLYLLVAHTTDDLLSNAGVQSALVTPAGVQRAATTVQTSPVQSALEEPVQPDGPTSVQPARPRPMLAKTSDDQTVIRSGPSPARDRARATASRHAHRHGRLPTVSELATAAHVSRGTAATALSTLREQLAAPQLIPDVPGEVHRRDPNTSPPRRNRSRRSSPTSPS